MTFEELIIECKNCTRCKLRENAIQVVPGAGNSKADIMFIGEAPGKQEDIQGLPFIGSSGKFLSEMLSSIGLSREDIYIANMIKCRPPENRDPNAEELLACSDWLTEQLRFINPKIVVTLGRFGMARFFGDKKISQIHGKVKVEDDKAYIALYHPAVALYNGSMRQVLLKDFQVIKEVLEMQKKGTLKSSSYPSLEINDPVSHIHTKPIDTVNNNAQDNSNTHEFESNSIDKESKNISLF